MVQPAFTPILDHAGALSGRFEAADGAGYIKGRAGEDIEEEHPPRKIIHIDMDAFFASVEQRDNPALAGKPVAVGGSEGRGVVAAASYESRRFGVRSAMPSVKAKKLCPDLIFCRPRFDVYRQVSEEIRAIFRVFTDLVEPLSLDEAYLDVTENKSGVPSATRIAQLIRKEIWETTRLTASAGVSYNKFLAKLASDQNKPDGLFVIRPGEGAAFVQSLPVRRFHGVGPRGAAKMARLGIETGADLAARDRQWLVANFGSFGDYLFGSARGIDRRPVRAGRIRKSIGSERTFAEDIIDPLDLRSALDRIIHITWRRIAEKQARGRTVTLKLRYADFRIVTRARSHVRSIGELAEFTALAKALLEDQLPLSMPIRLMGLTLSSLEQEEGPACDQLTLL